MVGDEAPLSKSRRRAVARSVAGSPARTPRRPGLGSERAAADPAGEARRLSDQNHAQDELQASQARRFAVASPADASVTRRSDRRSPVVQGERLEGRSERSRNQAWLSGKGSPVLKPPTDDREPRTGAVIRRRPERPRREGDWRFPPPRSAGPDFPDSHAWIRHCGPRPGGCRASSATTARAVRLSLPHLPRRSARSGAQRAAGRRPERQLAGL